MVTGSVPSFSLEFRNITLSVKEKVILKDVNGRADSGEILVFMGPSGSGKSTLLDCIAGLKSFDSGEITLNGKSYEKSTRRQIGYVQQQINMFPQLTLQETLYFAAMMKLPGSMTKNIKMKRLKELVEELNLGKCLNTIIGDATMRGLSGGEKKRASTAYEMISNPDILILDEPTSGLDSYSAEVIIAQVKSYASKGRIVILALHQPSSNVFHSIENLLLLTKGQVAYFGKSVDLLDHFKKLDLHCPANCNPADFVLEHLNSSNDELSRIIAAAKMDNGDESKRTHSYFNDGFYAGDQLINNAFVKSGFGDKETVPALHLASGSSSVCLCELEKQSSKNDGQERLENKWPTSFWTQYRLLTWRSFQLSKKSILNVQSLVQTLAYGIIMGVFFFQLENTEEDVEKRAALLFLMSGFLLIRSKLDGFVSFPAEKAVINKERLDGDYRLSAYLLGKMTTELIFATVKPAISVTLTYWMVGLNPHAGYFFAFLGVICIHGIFGQTVGFLVGAAFKDIRFGFSLINILILWSLSSAGFFIRNLPVWLDWTKYTSPIFYTFHAFNWLQFTDNKPLRCSNGAISILVECGLGYSGNTTYIRPDTVPSKTALQYTATNQPIYFYISVSIFAIIVIRIMLYLLLRFVHTPAKN